MSDFPVLQRHMGIWEGTYTLLDPSGKLLDQHKSRLEIQRNGSKYFQRNIYTWEDGRSESIDFPGELHDGRLWFETPRLSGSAVEADENVIILTWNYNNSPTQKLAEIIYLVDEHNRCRTWQFIENGQIVRVMLINEHKIADSVPYNI